MSTQEYLLAMPALLYQLEDCSRDGEREHMLLHALTIYCEERFLHGLALSS